MAKNAELGEFLRTQRAHMQPEHVGTATAGPRGVPGRRREEVAMVPGVGPACSACLEQGRDLPPSFPADPRRAAHAG